MVTNFLTFLPLREPLQSGSLTSLTNRILQIEISCNVWRLWVKPTQLPPDLLRCLLQGCFLPELRCLFGGSLSHRKGPCGYPEPSQLNLLPEFILQTRLRHGVSTLPGDSCLPTAIPSS